ncbi:hypothetical protein PR202_ga26592 [Eleusine coracana subsp. coracana]|uniref:Uncharacterized protein n=10 Tax=Eleusine TaxID=4510 RepID=A0AAV5DD08_ELECO|nr:hypothetical protein PR202_ga26592 [Eleusine coracana subsp. coracana]
MYKTLERYRTCNFNSQEVKAPLDSEINYQEYLKLKTRVEFLQTTQRYYSKMNQMLLDQLFDLKSKEQELQDLNKDLRKKLQETSGENALHISWEEGGHSGASGNANEPYQGFVQHPENDSSLQIGYQQQAYMDQLNNEDMAATHHPNDRGRSGWI